MSIRSFFLLMFMMFALGLVSGCGSDDSVAPLVGADVDTYVKSLPSWEEFSPPQVETNDLIDGPTDSSATWQGQDYDCEVSYYSMTANPREITVFSPDTDILWPGSLLQGHKYAGGLGSLGELPIRQRAPLKVFTDLLTADAAITVDNPDASSVAAAVGQLIEQATNAGHAAGSSIQFDQSTTYSLEQAALDLGFSVSYMGNDVQGALSYDRSVAENTLTAYFTQKMFTVSVVQPQTPGEFFSDAFTAERLQEQVDLGRIGPDNLPTYISSVVYGRMFVLTMTSTSSIEEMRDALTASRESIGSGSISQQDLDVLNASQIRISTVGGVDDGLEAMITSGTLGEYFAADAPLTSARPLSYTVRNLADNSIAIVSETTDYAISQCAPVAATPTGARYSLKVDKIKLTDYGCDLWPGSAPEVYWDFDLLTNAGTSNLGDRAQADAVEMELNTTQNINGATRYVNLYADGRTGSAHVVGTIWDEDGGTDDVIGELSVWYAYGATQGQSTFTVSGHGCGLTVYVTCTRVNYLYD